jgi:hypothetical protein
MDAIGIGLIAAGIAAIAVGAWMVREPLATIRRLDQTEANIARYESWRGKQRGVASDGPTGADEMRALMRGRVRLWAIVIVAGVVAVVLGYILR